MNIICILAALVIGLADYNVIPQPEHIELDHCNEFIMNNCTAVHFEEGLASEAEFLCKYVSDMTGIHLKCRQTKQIERCGIILRLNYDIKGDEQYKINVSSKSLILEGRTAAAVFYAVQTIRKSLPATKCTKVTFPSGTISDSPRYAYRGGMLDVARHFFKTDFVKEFIDILALHNCNIFHWHLTDDQGWRVEIEKYPQLTRIGSIRAQTLVGRHDKGIYDGTPHGGFYTKEELKDIVDYAAKRHITVIPEIDMPGHMVAALASYPHLGCCGGPYTVRQKWDIADDVLCAGNDSTIQFVKDVIDEICDIFPSRYIHIGGDECPKKAWKACPKCQARIKKLGLENKENPEEALQGWFMRLMSDYLATKGRNIIGWDEILDGNNLGKNDIIMSWRAEKGAIKATSQGIRSVISSKNALYFDRYQTLQTKDREPLAFGGCIPLEKVYGYDPANNREFTPEMLDLVIGCQANLWGEFIATPEYATHMFLPRAAGLSELCWCRSGRKDYGDFLERLKRLATIYDLYSWNYAKYVFEDQKK